MNTELKHTNIFESVAMLVPVLTFKHKNADSINLGLAFFIPISSIQPKSTKLDYIEAKTTLGGGQTEPSTIQIPLFLQFPSVCNAYPVSYDLKQFRNNAVKLKNRSII